MDAIQEFGYICAVEELNFAIESFEPASESAIDTIKNIAKKFWNFVMMVCQKIINGMKSIIRKMKANKSFSYDECFKINQFTYRYMPKMIQICEDVEDIIKRRGSNFDSSVVKDCAHEIQSKLNHAKSIKDEVIELIEKDLHDDDYKKDSKLNIDEIIDPLNKHIERFAKLEKLARNNATFIGNADPGDYRDPNVQRELMRLYNNAQSTYNIAISTITAVIAYITKI